MNYYPTYYQQFRCIAAACPDSCCQGWDVVIDEETEAFYRAAEGALGKRLRDTIYTDADGDRVFRLADKKKCPFWGADKLCELYKALGEEHLCVTCAQFPRLTMDYTVFREHTLALACPEAARLIVNADGAYTDPDPADVLPCEDYDIEIMRFLLDARRQAAAILTTEKPLTDRLTELEDYAAEVQTTLTRSALQFDNNSYREIYSEPEYIDERNRGRFVRAAKAPFDPSAFERELTHLGLYWLYRYFLGAIGDLDVLSPVRFLTASVRVAAALARESGDIVSAAQVYSKEIEQSCENIERMWERFAGQ